MKPYVLRRLTGYSIALGAIIGISYLGKPPLEEVVTDQQVPIQLKKQKKNMFPTNDFAYLKIFDGGEELCTIYSTTAVRSYFGNTSTLEERTRIKREVCFLPPQTKEVDVEITFPYQVDKDAITNTFDHCELFRQVEHGWRKNCSLTVTGDSRPVLFQGYELITGGLEKGYTKLRADRINALMVKTGDLP